MQHPAHVARRPARWRSRIGLAVAAGLVTLAVLEGALWLLWPLPRIPEHRLHRYLPSWSAVGPAPRSFDVDPGPLAGVTPGHVQVALNRLGYLFPEARMQRASGEELRVALVGGSTVECVMLAPQRRVSAALERRLGASLARPVTVLNLGTSAQDTRTHLATTAHVVAGLDVDVCVFLIGTNDLGTASMVDHPMLEPGAFYERPSLSRWLKEAFALTQIGRRVRRSGDEPGRVRTTPYFADAAALQQSLPVGENVVRLTADGLAHFARNVASLAGLCREHGITVLFATQPCMFSPEPTAEELSNYWGCHDGSHSIPAAEFAAMLGRVNAHLLATCAARGYACVDLAREVPRGLGFFYDQVHFNEAGAERVAEALAGPLCALLPPADDAAHRGR